MSASAPPTVLHYTGSRWDGSGVHAVIRQMAQMPVCRNLLGVAPGFVAEKSPRLPLWRGPAIEADRINLPNLWRAWRVACRVRRWLRRAPHRVFHGHTRAALLVTLWLHLLGERRIVATVHVYGSQTWFYRLARRCLGKRLVWLTPAMKHHYGIADASWDGCMPNGLATVWAKEFRRWPGDRPLRIGGAGMLVRWKRWDLILQALARLPKGRQVEFYHIGGSVDQPASQACEKELRALMESLDLAGRVHWLGWQDSSADLLRRVDAVVVPSDGEPFSMIALEALFAGVPVIATRGGGPEDFIVEGRNGWLVAAGDAAALAERLEICLDPREWETLHQEDGHISRFSLTETLGPRWAEIYAGRSIG